MISDAMLRAHLLSTLHGLRNNNTGWVPVSDMNFGGMEPVAPARIRTICEQLDEVGLVSFKVAPGELDGGFVGMLKISGHGSDVVQGLSASSLALDFSNVGQTDAPAAVAEIIELQLVPDTNLFFEFKALEQLPWEELRCDSIVLLLTKPVLDEIDRHKKGGGRTRDRALDIFGRFRAMLTDGLRDAEIRAAEPRVVLRRMTGILPDAALKDHLDYDKADERLIGIVSALKKRAASGHEVKLFTDDGGPAGMALDLGVPFLMIDQGWRRPGAETTEAKMIRELKKDLAAYRDQEPKIAIRCETADADSLVRVIGKVATPLTVIEVDELIEALRLKHPARVDFTPPPSTTTTDAFGETKTVEYSAPTDDEIANYRDLHYPGWIEQCRETLRNVHAGRDEEAPPVILRWVMSNDGSRPALRVRVEFERAGHLALQRVDGDDVEDAHSGAGPSADPPLRLPPVPRPPAFHEHVTIVSPAPLKPSVSRAVPLSSLRSTSGFSDYERAMDMAKMMGRFSDPAGEALRRLQDSAMGVAGLDATLRAAIMPVAQPVIEPAPAVWMNQLRLPDPPKPEKFYYDSWPVVRSVQKGALTCQVWRHQAGNEIFEFEVLFCKEGDVRGVIECTVHADNLTEPRQEKVVVQRKIEVVGMFALARAMVDAAG